MNLTEQGLLMIYGQSMKLLCDIICDEDSRVKQIATAYGGAAMLHIIVKNHTNFDKNKLAIATKLLNEVAADLGMPQTN